MSAHRSATKPASAGLGTSRNRARKLGVKIKPMPRSRRQRSTRWHAKDGPVMPNPDPPK